VKDASPRSCEPGGREKEIGKGVERHPGPMAKKTQRKHVLITDEELATAKPIHAIFPIRIPQGQD